MARDEARRELNLRAIPAAAPGGAGRHHGRRHRVSARSEAPAVRGGIASGGLADRAHFRCGLPRAEDGNWVIRLATVLLVAGGAARILCDVRDVKHRAHGPLDGIGARRVARLWIVERGRRAGIRGDRIARACTTERYGVFVVIEDVDGRRCVAAASGRHPAEDDVLVEGGAGVAAGVVAAGRGRNGDRARRAHRCTAVAFGTDRTDTGPRTHAVRPVATEGGLSSWLRGARRPGRALSA